LTDLQANRNQSAKRTGIVGTISFKLTPYTLPAYEHPKMVSNCQQHTEDSASIHAKDPAGEGDVRLVKNMEFPATCRGKRKKQKRNPPPYRQHPALEQHTEDSASIHAKNPAVEGDVRLVKNIEFPAT
jgi:hypothetical protein